MGICILTPDPTALGVHLTTCELIAPQPGDARIVWGQRGETNKCRDSDW